MPRVEFASNTANWIGKKQWSQLSSNSYTFFQNLVICNARVSRMIYELQAGIGAQLKITAVVFRLLAAYSIITSLGARSTLGRTHNVP